MNPTNSLSMVLLILIALLIVIAMIHGRREECLNARKAGEPEPAPEPLSQIELEAAAEVAGATPAAAPKGISEEEIQAKVTAGLTRAQAIEAIERQRSHDKAIKA